MKMYAVFLATILLSVSSCRKSKICPRNLDTYWSLSPIKDEYRVGDTISVSSKFSRYVDGYELFAKEEDYLGKFDMEGIYWEPYSEIMRIDSLYDVLNPYYSLFGILVEPLLDTFYDYEIHQHTSGNGLFGEYSYANDTFYLAYKFVFTNKGTYLLMNASLASLNRNFQYFPGWCKSEPQVEVRALLNDGHHNNAHLLAESPFPEYSDMMPVDFQSDFYLRGMYCFKVE